jgi:hypothetical protein
VRITITRRAEGEIDGMPLERFEPGHTYDVNSSIATYLIVMGCAQAVADTASARIVPVERTDEVRTRVKPTPDSAADRSRNKR